MITKKDTENLMSQVYFRALEMAHRQSITADELKTLATVAGILFDKINIAREQDFLSGESTASGIGVANFTE